MDPIAHRVLVTLAADNGRPLRAVCETCPWRWSALEGDPLEVAAAEHERDNLDQLRPMRSTADLAELLTRLEDGS